MSGSDRQRIEHFHLQVLKRLGATPEKAHLALKGGSNLRFFFGSIRYSEDMDLDVSPKGEVHALKERMDGVLTGPSMNAALRATGMEVTRVSAPKQTETTQRWKVELAVRTRPAVMLHTKIELSRRVTTEEAVLEAVSPEILAAHELLPLLVRHYPLDAALRQKVQALVGRAAVRARDVFDLALLVSRSTKPAAALEPERAALPRAIERAMDVSFDDFQGQVVAYLHPDHAAMYASHDAWNALQGRVVEVLEAAAR